MIFNKMRVYLLSVVVFTLFINCTSLNSSTNRISIKSNPSMANITIYDKTGNIIGQGTTPDTIYLYGKTPFRVVIQKPFYEPEEYLVKRTYNFGRMAWILLPGFGWVYLLVVDDYWKVKPNEINVSLRLNAEGIEEQNRQDLARQEETRRRAVEEETKRQYIRSIIGDSRVITLQHEFNFSNPYAFDTNVIYHSGGDYLYLHQWLGTSFIAGFLPEAFLLELPYNIQFFIKTVPDLSKIKSRMSNVYLRYVGAQNFTRGNGSTITLAVFDLLYHE
jgi:hypothetical protein